MKFNEISTKQDYFKFVSEDKTINSLIEYCFEQSYFFNNRSEYDQLKHQKNERLLHSFDAPPDKLDLITRCITNKYSDELFTSELKTLVPYTHVLRDLISLSLVISLSKKIDSCNGFFSEVIISKEFDYCDCLLRIRKDDKLLVYQVFLDNENLFNDRIPSIEYLQSIVTLNVSDVDGQEVDISQINFNNLEISIQKLFSDDHHSMDAARDPRFNYETITGSLSKFGYEVQADKKILSE